MTGGRVWVATLAGLAGTEVLVEGPGGVRLRLTGGRRLEPGTGKSPSVLVMDAEPVPADEPAAGGVRAPGPGEGS